MTIARPYARAAFEIADSEKRISQWSEFLRILGQITQQPVIARMIGNPMIDGDTVAEVLCCGFSAGLTPRQGNFIRLLADARRLMFTSRIAELFADYQASAEQTINVNITSAQPLTEEQTTILQQALQHRLNRRIVARQHTDETLLGGAVIRAGDQVIDGSFKTKLEKLSAELAHE